MDIEILEYIILGTFVAACAYFNFRSGYRQGVMDGLDASLAILEQQKFIHLIEHENGDISIEKNTDDS